jgi:hypothetical protein
MFSAQWTRAKIGTIHQMSFAERFELYMLHEFNQHRAGRTLLLSGTECRCLVSDVFCPTPPLLPSALHARGTEDADVKRSVRKLDCENLCISVLFTVSCEIHVGRCCCVQ